MSAQRGHRQPHDLEVGINNLFAEHPPVHLAERPPPPKWLSNWELRRPIWLQELVAEAFGVFIYTWLGFGATAAMITTNASNAGGTLFTIAICYGLGITVGVLVAGPNSGGHLHPAFTISFALYKGFPWRKVPAYIFAQLMGGFVSGLIVYAQFSPQLSALKAQMIASGNAAEIFTPAGPSGVMAVYPPPFGNMGIVFLNEIVASATLGAIVFSVLDPSNPFLSPGSGPFVIGATFFAAIAGYAGNGIALNTARDLGPRFAAAVIWGKGVMPPRFTAEACLTNILGTALGAGFQTLWLSDSARPHTKSSAELQEGMAKTQEAVLARSLTRKSEYTDGSAATRVCSVPVSSNDFSEKNSV